jgi:hypothetical protein
LKQLPAFAAKGELADMAKDTMNAMIAFGADAANNNLQEKGG